jgi:hypothetical protein
MFQSPRRTRTAEPVSALIARRRSRASRQSQCRLSLEHLEDRSCPAGTVTITSLLGPSTLSAVVPAAIEGSLASPSLNATFTDTNALAPSHLTVTVNYGDGTPVSTNQGANADPNLLITRSGTTYTVIDTHTFPEESGSTVPPFSFGVTLTVTETANTANTETATGSADVLDAALAPGNPVQPVSGGVFEGGNTGNPISAAQAEGNFETAIGGVKNTLAAPQNGGFRVINWDGVKTDGTDSAAGPNSTVVITNHTVGIPLNRFQGQGLFFGAVYAVTNDGFTDVNPSVAGLFPAFTPPNTFAMFNDNGIDFKFVTPASPLTPPVSAASRGFGAIFLNVQQAGATTIQYFHGATLLDTLTVPVNTLPGKAVFAGELFTNPIVTNVLLTLGQGVIFRFDGTTVTSGNPNSATNNLVATDDFVFPEPVPTVNGFPIVSGAQGLVNAAAIVKATLNTPFTGVVASFTDLDPNGTARDYTATINWGDGHFSLGTITRNAQGGFDVSGTNTYSVLGSFPINVDIADFGGGPGVGGSQPTLSVNNTATVAAGDQNFRFVAQAFQDLLGRTVDVSSLTFWGTLLDSGQVSRPQVVAGITNSLEFRIVQVTQAYQQILQRKPDAVGLDNFVQFLINGGTVEQVKAALAGSQEFFNDAQALDTTAGLTTANQKVVDFLFQRILNRPADATGLGAFTQQLANNVSQSTVALELLTSPEGYGDLVEGYFGTFLRRHSDPGGLNAFIAQLQAGFRDETVIGEFVSSDEYFARV